MKMKQIISAAVTPFTQNNELDLDSAARLFARGLKQKLDGFFVMGSMGEWALLTPDERDSLAKLACDVIGDRAKVLLGISDAGLPSILRNMEKWSGLKHSHWVVMLPSGWAGPGNPVDYIHKIADAADRPLYFYYLPQANNVMMTPGQFRDALSHPRVVGVKNSAGSVNVRKELLLLKQTMEFELYDGDEWGIDEALMLGCDGAIAGFASTAGALMKNIAAEIDAGNLENAQALQYKLIELFHAIYGDGAKWWSAGQKYALEYLGIISASRSRVASQWDLPESQKAAVRACVDANRDLLCL